MKKAPSLSHLFASNRFVLFFSLFCAIISWIVVAMTSKDIIPQTILNVPVNPGLQAEALADVGLTIVPAEETFVTVNIEGQRTIVGDVTAGDFNITARVSGITEPNTYPLTLVNEGQLEGFEITSIEPATIQVRLDQIESREFEVETAFEGVAVPPNHYMDTTPSLRQSIISVTGPQSELEKIDRVRAVVELDEDSLTSTYTANVPVTLLDAAGNEIDPADSSLSLNYENIDVTIYVYRYKTVPFRIDYTNRPDSFPLDELLGFAVVSPRTVRISGSVVSGQSNLIDSISEIPLGSISLRELTPEHNTFAFSVAMPSDRIKNDDNVRSVSVVFETDYWATKTFNVTDIQTTNQPPGFEVTLLTPSVSVTFVGPEDLIAQMTVEDIVAEVRLSDEELEPGQYPFPVRLSAPSAGCVWAAGPEPYTVIIQADPLNPTE
ncbi:MAG: hypothetical protein LBU86_07200 [Oscillospiraceae bacterium]|jgi:YbbR domain-containing protein|nr:hypothetical protein [Oscillospiraceae bacterium]